MKILTDTGLMVLWHRIKDLYKKISVSAKQTTTSTADGGTNVMTFTFGDGTSTTLSVKNGSKGSDGAKGEKGDRGPVGETGPQGNSGIADASNKALINDAVTGGETSYLSAEIGKLGILTYDCSKGGTVEHASLQDAINAVPTTFRKVGITIIYKSGDSIYSYALKSNSWSTDSTNWFSVEEKVSDLSDNLKNAKISYGAFLGQGLENIAFEYINDTYIDTFGKQNVSNIYVSSKFIKVNADEEYLCVTSGSDSTAAIAGYSSDDENSFVKVIELNGETKPFLKKIKIPASIKYIRLTFNTTNLNISNFSIYKIRQNCLNNLELQEKYNEVQKKLQSLISPEVFESANITTIPTTLNDKYGNTTRINVYKSFKYAKFVNFEDYEKTLKVYVYWNTYSDKFNIRLAYLNSNSEWVQAYSLLYNYEDINPTKQAIISIIYNVPNSNKRIELLVDTSLVQMPDEGIIFSSLTSNPEYIFAKTCFVNEEAKTGYKLYVPKTIKLYPNDRLPTISFEFDDINENDVDVHNLFVEKGLRCGFAFVASDTIIKRYSSTYLDWQSEGFDILNHSIDGKEVTTVNYDYNAALNAIATAKGKLEKAGFVINGWVSPSSVLSPEFLPIIKKFHAYGFTMKDSFENGRQSNPCQLIRYGMQGNTLEQIKSKIDEYISKDKILVLYGHSADFGTSYVGETWDINKIGQVLDYCLEKRNSGLCYLGNTDDCIKYYFKL